MPARNGSGTRSVVDRNSEAISVLVTKQYHLHAGRAPARVRAYLSSDLVTVVLEDSLQRGERSLAEAGKAGQVLTRHHAVQHAMRDALIAGVEQITGRRVRAFLSTHNVDPDVAAEIFVLDSAEGRLDGAD